MKILHVDSGREWRGGQAQVAWLMAGLRERGHDQLLAAPPGSPLATRSADRGFGVLPIGVRGDVDARASLRLATVARDFRPDVVHAHTAHAHMATVSAARLAGIAGRVVTRRSALRVGGHPFSKLKYRMGVTRYIAISRHVADTLIGGGVDPRRVSVVYSGVPLPVSTAAVSPENRRESRKRLGIPGEAPLLALIGALTSEKGHDVALAALSYMKEPAHLVFIGDGPGGPRLRTRAERLGIASRVTFAGFRADLDEIRAGFDLVVAPSRHEGLGTSVIEALGVGIPVVASSAGGLAEVLEGGRGGITLATEDPEVWGRAIDDMLANGASRARLAEAGRRRAGEFTIERMVGGTEEVYRTLFSGRAPIAAWGGSREVET